MSPPFSEAKSKSSKKLTLSRKETRPCALFFLGLLFGPEDEAYVIP
jgi:hypothetical protein